MVTFIAITFLASLCHHHHHQRFGFSGDKHSTVTSVCPIYIICPHFSGMISLIRPNFWKLHFYCNLPSFVFGLICFTFSKYTTDLHNLSRQLETMGDIVMIENFKQFDFMVPQYDKNLANHRQNLEVLQYNENPIVKNTKKSLIPCWL